MRFPEGFELFQNYKRREYRAIAHSGVWIREDTQEQFPTLNRLNESIVAGNEKCLEWELEISNARRDVQVH